MNGQSWVKGNEAIIDERNIEMPQFTEVERETPRRSSVDKDEEKDEGEEQYKKLANPECKLCGGRGIIDVEFGQSICECTADDSWRMKKKVVEKREEKKEGNDWSVLADPNCKWCKGSGQRSGILGLSRCQCTVNGSRREQDNKDRSDNVEKVLRVADEKRAVATRVVPADREKDEFDVEVLRQRVKESYTNDGKTRMQNYLMYEEILKEIITKIKFGDKITNSYLIGAPNGMSKNTFANYAIKICQSKGMKVVPYVSLLEIYDKYVQHMERSQARLYSLVPAIEGWRRENDTYEYGCCETLVEYKWLDFVNADILFTCVNDSSSAEVEVFVLKSLLKARARMGKPTVVFMDIGIQRFTRGNNNALVFKTEFINNTPVDSLSKLRHISCFLAK